MQQKNVLYLFTVVGMLSELSRLPVQLTEHRPNRDLFHVYIFAQYWYYMDANTLVGAELPPLQDKGCSHKTQLNDMLISKADE